MKIGHALVAGALALACACQTYRPGKGPLEGFEFLAGTWARTTPGETVEERWTSASAWSLRGAQRTLRDGAVVAEEALAIEPRGASFVLVTRPRDGAPLELRLEDRGEDWARFASASPGFPQRIEYRRAGDQLVAIESGTEQGRTRREVVGYRRVDSR